MLALTSNFFKKNLVLIFFLISFPAFAHHPMGGALPQNFLNGILSGIAHPIIGFDHLAFILTFGIIASYFKNKFILPLYFITFSLIGTILSVNFLVVPFSELINEDNTFIDKHKILEKFKSTKCQLDTNLVFSCGSGVTASVLALAYSLIDNKYMPKIYDGSWSEYGKI